MKEILKALRSKFNKLEKIINNRESVFDKRTEKWQETRKGLNYQSITIELEEVKDNLEDTIICLQKILSNIK